MAKSSRALITILHRKDLSRSSKASIKQRAKISQQGRQKMVQKNQHNQPSVVTIKKYANRRLYNTATSSYVTLGYLAEMVRKSEDFIVIEAKSGNDITHSILTQIIVDEESKGQSLLPTNFLRQIISYYGGNLQSFIPSYLEISMKTFQKNQEIIRQSMAQRMDATSGFKAFEDTTRQNMALFQQGLKMIGLPTTSPNWKRSEGDPSKKKESTENTDLTKVMAENTELHRQIKDLKSQLKKL